jgi:hypothetical protein
MLALMKQMLVSLGSNLQCRALLPIAKPTRSIREYYFSICAIFKNEAPYLEEWIEFHRMIGVEHIYLYNNFSEDAFQSVLAKYIDEGFVSLKDWFFEHGQMSAYEDCYQASKYQTQWLMFLDLDEFICLKYETSITEWIKKFENFPAVIIYWLMFGTNGVVRGDSESLVIEQYTQSWEKVRNVGKIALNTDYKPIQIYHHNIFCAVELGGAKFKIPMINENRRFIRYPGKEKCPKNGTIQINHYWSKSLQEYIRKIGKGDVFSDQHEKLRKEQSFFFWHEHQNTSENRLIWRFLIGLKIRMKKLRFELD